MTDRALLLKCFAALNDIVRTPFRVPIYIGDTPMRHTYDLAAYITRHLKETSPMREYHEHIMEDVMADEGCPNHPPAPTHVEDATGYSVVYEPGGQDLPEEALG